ncbi:MAG: hypothetical protein KDE51_09350, partial [Anaerolineales bacterium]|nr:hypothetical protein [Anaerolineales bacterium]
MDDRRLARQRRRRQNQRTIATTSLFLFGLLAGLLGGLYYAWVVDSGDPNTAGVEVLRDTAKADYIFMVSQTYAANGDWEQAATRLARLQDPTLNTTVIALLEQYLREGRPAEQVRNLARLAEQLGAESPVLALFAPTPAAITAVTAESDASPTNPNPTPTATLLPTPTPNIDPTPSPSPTVSPTPLPSATPTAVPDYRLLEQEQACQANPQDPPRLEVVVVDANLQPLPGVEIVVSWGENQSDRFYTGFKPQAGLGYADFIL